MTSKPIPRDAHVIQSILKDMGIIDYEPRVVNQLLEFVYRKLDHYITQYKKTKLMFLIMFC